MYPVVRIKHPSIPPRRMTEQEDRAPVAVPAIRQQEDSALIAAIAARQQGALDRLYDRYQTMVYHLAWKILRNRESAEEIVYEVFWQVWREADRYTSQRGSVGTWVGMLARSRAIDALRAQRSTLIAEDALEDHSLATDRAEDPEEVSSLEQRAVLVRGALDSLPSDQRKALELAFFSGFTHTEIASQLDEPLGTVKTRIRAAMLKLRERLQPLLGGKL
jgi:RNA polymerase sigma-70 factor (ECF subfamily)